MLALSTIANAKADEIYDHLDLILSIMKGGSVIAVDNAVKVLAATASGKAEFNKQIFPILLDNLRTCRPKEVPQHAESTMPAVNQMNQTEFLKVLEERQSSLTKAQATRINQLKKKLPRVP